MLTVISRDVSKCSAPLILALAVVATAGYRAAGQDTKLKWGFDASSGNFTTTANEGSVGSTWDGAVMPGRGTPTYSSDIPPANRRQNTTGIGSVNFATTNATLITSPGVISSALTQTDVVNAGGMTMQAWYKRIDAPQGGNNIGGIMDFGGAMLLRETAGGFSVLVNSSGLPTPAVTVSELERQNQWNHLAAVFATNGTAHTLSLYLNGVLAQSLSHPQLPSFSAAVTARPITVGGRHSDTLFDLEGLVYEPSLTLGALNPSQFTTNGVPPTPVTLQLEVNRSTRAMKLTNPTGADIPLLGYRITSTAGALDQSGWRTISGFYDASGTGPDVGTIDSDDNWTVLTNPGVYTDLSEAQIILGPGLENGGVMQTTDVIEFGNVWIKSPLEDIQFEILTPSETVVACKVVYTQNSGAAFVNGDLNFDGNFNIADWVKFKSVYGTNVAGMSRALAYQNGDLTNDQVSDLADFNAFENLYDTAFGVGALAKAIASVPEPASGTMMAMLAVAGGLTTCRGRRSKTETVASATICRSKLRRHRIGAIRMLTAGCCVALSSAAATAQTNSLKWGFDFSSGSVGVVDGGTVNNDGTGGPQLAGQRIADRGVPEYRSDIPPVARRQNTTGVGSVDFFGNTGTLRAVGTVSSLANNTSVVAAGGITLQTWFKQTASPQGGSSIGALIDVGGAMLLRDVTGGFSVLVNSSGNPTPFVAVTDADKRNGWNHLAAIWATDGTNHTLSIYLNGVLGQSLSHPQVPVFTTAANSLIGIGNRGSDTQFDLEGLIYEPTITMGVVAPANFTYRNPTPLTLEVNTTSGLAKIRNLSLLDEQMIKSYSIKSPSGSLSPAALNSLQKQNYEDPTPGDKNNGDGWEIIGTPTSNQIAEAQLIGNTLFSPSEEVTLGKIFRKPSGDFNGSGTVNDADFAQWAVAYGVNANGDFDGDEDSDPFDFLGWQLGYGSTPTPRANDLVFTYTLESGQVITGSVSYVPASEAAGISTPEPAAFVSMALGGLGVMATARRRRPSKRTSVRPTRTAARRTVLTISMSAALVCLLDLSSALGVIRLDRNYRLGDDSLELGVPTQAVGNISYDSEGPSKAYLDLTRGGDPVYMNAANRPGALSGNVGIAFNGNDSLSTTISMNAPSQMWDNGTFFPSLDYPLNYENIYAHGIQLWAQPTLPASATRQDVVLDTAQQGIVITATGTWGLQHAATLISSTTTVSSTVDANGWVHVMQLGGGRDVKLGRSQTGGALLVNGIVVAASAAAYGTDATKLSIGSNQAGTGNFYNGALDDVRIFLWGENLNQSNNNNPNGPFGQNYGALDLGTDNDWIKLKLASLGVTQRADVNLNQSVSGNGTGSAATDDVKAFVDNWGYRQVVNGLVVGDWNSRQHGDLNYDGATDLLDAFILHQGLIAAGGPGLDFSLLFVPEPTSAVLVVVAAFGAAARRHRRQY